MDIRQLKTFVEVARVRSFSKAAESLFLTQPTVSNHIQSLEKEFDTILINRLSKGLTLTDAGQLLYQNALDIINTYETARYQLDSYKGKVEGHLEISASSVPRKHLLPILIHSFLEKYPDVSFSISDKDSRQVIEEILIGDTDFGFVGAVYEPRNLTYIPVMEDNLVLIAPEDFFPDHENLTSISLDMIVDYPFIFREEGSGTRESVRLSMESKGFNLERLKTVAWIEDVEAIKRMVALGVGLSFISEKDIDCGNIVEGRSYKVLRVDDLDLSRKFYLVHHKSRQLSPIGESFKSSVKSLV